MAMAHAGLHPRGNPRLRILICLCELAESGTSGSYRDVQRRLGISGGALSHHVDRLHSEGLLVRSSLARTLKLTAKAHALLISEGWLVPSQKVVSFQLSDAAIELLETAETKDGADGES